MDGIIEKIDTVELRELYAHWQTLRGDRFAPPRRDLDPTRIPRLLPHLILTEILADGRLRYRLTGTEVEHFFGGRMTGRHVDELTSGEYRRFIEGLYRTVVEKRVPAYSRNAYAEHGMRTFRLMLPLSNDGAGVGMVLAGQMFERRSASRNRLAAGHGPASEVEVALDEPR